MWSRSRNCWMVTRCWTSSPGPHLPQRLRANAAGRRPGPDVPARSSGDASRLPGGVREDRYPLPPGGGPLRSGERHPGDQVQEGHPEDRRDAALLARPCAGGTARGGAFWRGLHLVLLDGTALDVQDTEANWEHGYVPTLQVGG